MSGYVEVNKSYWKECNKNGILTDECEALLLLNNIIFTGSHENEQETIAAVETQ